MATLVRNIFHKSAAPLAAVLLGLASALFLGAAISAAKKFTAHSALTESRHIAAELSGDDQCAAEPQSEIYFVSCGGFL